MKRKIFSAVVICGGLVVNANSQTLHYPQPDVMVNLNALNALHQPVKAENKKTKKKTAEKQNIVSEPVTEQVTELRRPPALQPNQAFISKEMQPQSAPLNIVQPPSSYPQLSNPSDLAAAEKLYPNTQQVAPGYMPPPGEDFIADTKVTVRSKRASVQQAIQPAQPLYSYQQPVSIPQVQPYLPPSPEYKIPEPAPKPKTVAVRKKQPVAPKLIEQADTLPVAQPTANLAVPAMQGQVPSSLTAAKTPPVVTPKAAFPKPTTLANINSVPPSPPAPPPLPPSVIAAQNQSQKISERKIVDNSQMIIKPALPPLPAAQMPTPVPLEQRVSALPPLPSVSKPALPSIATLPPLPSAPPPPPNIAAASKLNLPPAPLSSAPAVLPSSPKQLSDLFEKPASVPNSIKEATKPSIQSVAAASSEINDVIAAPRLASLTINYSEAQTDLPISEQSRLQSIADQLIADQKLVLRIRPYASGTPDQAGQATRTSLARGLAIRKFFLDRNIQRERIDLKPMGNKATSGVPDRVDIFTEKVTKG